MFCSKCGNQVNNDASFCPKCGNKINMPIQPQAPVYNNVAVATPIASPVVAQTATTAPTGRAAGIVGMILSIIGLAYSFVMVGINAAYLDFLDMLDVPSRAVSSLDFDTFFVTFTVFLSIFSILGTIFSGVGLSRGFKNGVSISGLIMGLVGLLLFIISIASI